MGPEQIILGKAAEGGLGDMIVGDIEMVGAIAKTSLGLTSRPPDRMADCEISFGVAPS